MRQIPPVIVPMRNVLIFSKSRSRTGDGCAVRGRDRTEMPQSPTETARRADDARDHRAAEHSDREFEQEQPQSGDQEPTMSKRVAMGRGNSRTAERANTPPINPIGMFR